MVLVNNPGTWSAVYRPLTHAEWQAAALGLVACAWLVDVAGYRRWTGPFVIFGTNALALFFLSTLGALLLVAIRVDQGNGSTLTLQSLLYRTLYIAACLAPPNALLSAAPVRSFDGGEALTDRRDP